MQFAKSHLACTGNPMAAPSQRDLGQKFMETVGLVEAPLRSAWSRALEWADCKQLMNLLEENPCRVV